MVETNTFGATTVAQADYDMADLAIEMNFASRRSLRVRPATNSARPRSRASSSARLGPTPKTASISPDVNDPGARNTSFEELRQKRITTRPKRW